MLAGGVARRFELFDHGVRPDEKANDGWYTGQYLFQRRAFDRATDQVTEDRPGDWYLFVLAQDVNSVTQGTAPFDAAHTIGGFVLTPQLELDFNGPCALRHDAVIHVV